MTVGSKDTTKCFLFHVHVLASAGISQMKTRSLEHRWVPAAVALELCVLIGQTETQSHNQFINE